MKARVSSFFLDRLKEAQALFPFFILILLFAALGEMLWRTHGMYHFRRFIWMLFFFALWLWVAFRGISVSEVVRRLSSGADRWILFLLGCALSTFLYKLHLKPVLFYVNVAQIVHGIRNLIEFSFYLSLVVLAVVAWKGAHSKTQFWIKGFLVVIGSMMFGTKIMTLIGAPEPHIDVFTSNTAAAKYFLDGFNPYSQSYEDIYGGLYDYTPGYAYWPGLLIWQAPALKFFGDIRWGLFIADVGSLLLLWVFMLRLQMRKIFAWFVLVLWICFPVQNFVIEQSWIDPILVFYSLFFAWAFLSKRWILAAISVGLLCATKQYGVWMGLLSLFAIYRQAGPSTFVKSVFTSAAAFFLTILPLAIQDWNGFYQMSIQTPLSQRVRLDSFSIPAILMRDYDVSLSPSFLSIFTLLGLVFGVVYLLRQKDHFLAWAGATSIAYLWTFAWGKQAFCNYYYFASIFVLIFMLGWLSRFDKEIRRQAS